jgi:tRNA pseudouridine65 synthase
MKAALDPWKSLCLNKRCGVLSIFDNGLIAIVKPCGLLTHPNHTRQPSSQPVAGPRTIIHGEYHFKNELFKCTSLDGDHTVHLLHRLDKGTSGVLMLSTDQNTAKLVRSMFKQRLVHKEYFAVVNGLNILGNKKEMMWNDEYSKVYTDRAIRATFNPQAVHETIAKTKVTVEAENPSKNISLLRLEPHTGFSHQLRYQCALHGCPILGDDTYGNFSVNKNLNCKRLFLHSHRIMFSIPSTSDGNGTMKEVNVCAPLPKDFTDLFSSNFSP